MLVHRLPLPCSVLAVMAAPGLAQQATPADVAAVLRIPETIDVMRDEGLAYGTDTSKPSSFPGRAAAAGRGLSPWSMTATRWSAASSRRWTERLDAPGAKLDEITAFFGLRAASASSSWNSSARRALLDQSVEEAAQVAVQELQADGDPRFELLERFAEANDLVEENVSGALNANLAFYRGMADGGAFAGARAQRGGDAVRRSGRRRPTSATRRCPGSTPYLMLAYEPLSDEDMEATFAFSESEAGRGR